MGARGNVKGAASVYSGEELRVALYIKGETAPRTSGSRLKEKNGKKATDETTCAGRVQERKEKK